MTMGRGPFGSKTCSKSFLETQNENLISFFRKNPNNCTSSEKMFNNLDG